MEAEHPLKAYLRRPEVDLKKFAETLGVSRVTVWRWANRKGGIDLPKAIEIERITDGLVKPSDFARPV